jgi:hypothetical protein
LLDATKRHYCIKSKLFIEGTKLVHYWYSPAHGRQFGGSDFFRQQDFTFTNRHLFHKEYLTVWFCQNNKSRPVRAAFIKFSTAKILYAAIEECQNMGCVQIKQINGRISLDTCEPPDHGIEKSQSV